MSGTPEPVPAEPVPAEPPLAEPPSAGPPEAPRAAVVLIARRELVERLRERSFAVSTAVTLLILLVIALAPRLVGGRTEFTVGTLGTTGAAVAATAQAAAAADGVTVHAHPYLDRATALEDLRRGEVAALLDATGITVQTALPDALAPYLQAGWRGVQSARVLAGAGVTPEVARQALAPHPAPVTAVQPHAADVQATRNVVFVGMIVLYGQMFGYGVWVASGVVEEKASRVVELLLSTVRPRQLLAGKVVGIGLLGALQLCLIAVVALAAAVTLGSVRLPPGIAGAVGMVLAWFALGYAFYAVAFAAAAATVSRQEDLQNVVTPLNLVIIGSFVLSFVALQRPSGPLATVASYLPPFSVLTMPLRWAQGSASGWQVAVSAAVMVAATVLLVRLGARIYERGVLRFGSRTRMRDLLRGPA